MTKNEALEKATQILANKYVRYEITDEDQEFHVEIHQEPTHEQYDREEDGADISKEVIPWWLSIEVPNKPTAQIRQNEVFQTEAIFQGGPYQQKAEAFAAAHHEIERWLGQTNQ